MRVSRVGIISVITALGASGAILASTAAATATPSQVYLHASQSVSDPGVYLHA
jgi:hypothetical protein